MRLSLIILILTMVACNSTNLQVKELDFIKYDLPWKSSFSIHNTIINRIGLPDNFSRTPAQESSFAHWLRRLPLKDGKPKVKLYNGKTKFNQFAHAYVLDLDVGNKDLQQCADAAMRLRAEYLFSHNKTDSIHFNYTNGAYVPFSKWNKGFYPVPTSGNVFWKPEKKNDGSYLSLKRYLSQIFNYAGTLSLSKELKRVPLNEIQPGDIFVTGGSPGHAVMVMDVAINSSTGEKIFLMAQGGTPAQEMHILKNKNNSSLSPWYSISEVESTLRTPTWVFSENSLMRWV